MRILLPFAFLLCLAACRHRTDPKVDHRGVIDSLVGDGKWGWFFTDPSDTTGGHAYDFQNFLQTFSEAELTMLCEDRNPALRCYAFAGLAQKASPHTFEVLLRHLHDTANVYRSVSLFPAVHVMLEQIDYFGGDRGRFFLRSDQYHKVDSLLLFERKFEHQYGWLETPEPQMLRKIPPRPEYYDRLRQLVNMNVFEALPAVARYKKLSDTAFIASFLQRWPWQAEGPDPNYFAYEAAAEFPHPSFYKQLVAALQKERMAEQELASLYKALFHYPNEQTLRLLRTDFARPDNYRRRKRREMFEMVFKEERAYFFADLFDNP